MGMINDVQYFTQASGIKTAYRWAPPKDAAQPTAIFLPGYMSDMDGGKACAVFDHAKANGQGALLLDYSGCGRSEGDFSDGSLSVWRDEVCALIADKISGPVILIGSSMGGWLMLMVALQLPREAVYAMIGIAAAPDFTQWGFSGADMQIIACDGVLYEHNPYGPQPTPTYKKFFDDGQANLLLDDDIAVHCPVILFHGQNDDDVPYEISLKLAECLCSSHVHINLVKDATHRFSRDSDVAMLMATLDNIWK